MSLREGVAVQFCGDIGDGKPGIGDLGRVLVDAGSHAHVMWSTGARANQVDLIDANEVVAVRGTRAASTPVSDTLAYGPMVTVAVRDTYDDEGPAGLLTALNEAGHLAGLVDVAEHALGAVTAQIRQDEAMHQVLATLDEGEAEQFVSMTALALMRDAFGPSTEEEDR